MAVGSIDGVVALTEFCYVKKYGRFAWTNKSGRNNERGVRKAGLLTMNFQRSYQRFTGRLF